jgi:hypothetical protein
MHRPCHLGTPPPPPIPPHLLGRPGKFGILEPNLEPPPNPKPLTLYDFSVGNFCVAFYAGDSLSDWDLTSLDENEKGPSILLCICKQNFSWIAYNSDHKYPSPYHIFSAQVSYQTGDMTLVIPCGTAIQ